MTGRHRSGKGDVPPRETCMETGPQQKQAGSEQARDEAIVTFRRKPTKSGVHHCIWIPRQLVREGRIDPDAEYEVFLRKAKKKWP